MFAFIAFLLMGNFLVLI